MRKGQPTRDQAISVRVTEDVKRALEKAASDDDRSVASLGEKIWREWLKANGYLPNGFKKSSK